MKQRLTVDDVVGLTDSEKVKLRVLWIPQDGDWFYGTHMRRSRYESDEYILSPYEVDGGYYGASLTESPPDKDAIPLLTIGQMIEILLSKGSNWHDIKDIITYGSDGMGMIDLCDSLWNKVKELLR